MSSSKTAAQSKPDWSDEFWQELADADPLGLGVDVQDVKDWFDWIWLRFKYGGKRGRPYRNHKRAVVAWWSRVQEWEITRARARGQRIRDRQETEAIHLRALSRVAEPQPPRHHRRSLKRTKLHSVGGR